MPEPTPVLPEVLAQIRALPASTRPLIICDVDEVVLHLIAHLEDYLHARDLQFLKHEYRLTGNIGRQGDSQPLAAEEVRRHPAELLRRSQPPTGHGARGRVKP